MSNVVSFARVESNPVLDKAAEKAGITNIKELAEGRFDVYYINPYHLKVKEGHNTREMESPDNLAHIDDLAQSIAENGVQRPLVAWRENGELYVVDGHCRLAATLRAIEHYGATHIDRVPVQLETRGSNEQDRLLAQVTLNSGRQLSTYEQGKLFARLMRLGMSESEIAKKLGKSVSHVSQCLSVQEAPKELRDLVINNQVAHTLAAGAIRDHGADAAAELLSEAIRVANQRGKSKATAKDLETVKDQAKASGEVVAKRPAERITRQQIAAWFEENESAMTDIENADGEEGRFMPESLFNELRRLVGF